MASNKGACSAAAAFVLCSDPSIRCVIARLRGFCAGYADHLGMAFRDLPRELPGLLVLFGRWAEASGLQLNWRKCMVVPVSSSTVD
eukprot:15477320-Alexandrium_andersonii.AAC.1